MKNFRNEAIEYYDSGITSPAQIARLLVKDLNLPDDPKVLRKSVSNWIKAHDHIGLSGECDEAGIPIEHVTSYWYKSKMYSIRTNKPKDEFDQDSFIKAVVAEVSKWSPSYPRVKRVKNKDPHCLVFDPADIHVGKICSTFETGEEYNSQVAVKRVMEGLGGIIQRSNGYEIDKVIFVAGNDILHTDTPRRTTTAGTPQDTDGMWYDNFMDAKRLLVDIIETLVTIADVEVVYNPSNHDYMSGFMLIQAVEAWFRHSKNITFNTNMSHRKYSVYGKNLIGTTHMDGAKINDLPMLMAQEASENWHHCIHRYIYGHHVHHGTKKDFGSVCVETLRSPSGTDSWHHRNGYVHAPKAVEGCIHHPEFGKVAHLSYIF
jgi:hypothetical protein